MPSKKISKSKNLANFRFENPAGKVVTVDIFNKKIDHNSVLNLIRAAWYDADINKLKRYTVLR